MIARIWEGKTSLQNHAAYTAFMQERAIPDYQSTPGFVKLCFLKRLDDQYAYFKLITYWQNLEVIENFAGADLERAKYYPEDQDYLLAFPEKVVHHEVFAEVEV